MKRAICLLLMLVMLSAALSAAAQGEAIGRMEIVNCEEWVSFRCEERIMDQMIDIFGPQMKVLPSDPGYFTARIKTTANGALFLAQQFMDAMEITDPPELERQFQKRLKSRLHQ